MCNGEKNKKNNQYGIISMPFQLFVSKIGF